MARARKQPYRPTEGVKGDHGTGTAAAMAETVLVAVPGDKNGMRRRQRLGALDRLRGKLSQRQMQAGQEIRNAFEATQKSPPAIKEIHVDASPKPDATIDVQCDAQSRFALAMSEVPSHFKHIVIHVCIENRPISELGKGRMLESDIACLQVSLDLVANRLNY
ncbi:MAG: hypothetical protein AAF405_00220 [Pseudomonadota bacterium]